jgi:hypothetical protein
VDNIIKTLCKLEEIDTQYESIKNQLQSSPGSILELEQQLSDLQTQLEASENELSLYVKKQRTYESDIKDNEQHVKRSREKIKSIKSNKEYQALLKEIEDTEKKNTVLEEEVLKCMYEKEESSTIVQQEKEKAQSIQEQLIKEQTIYNARRKEIEQEYEKLAEEKKILETQLPENMKKRYDYLRKACKGVAVGFVENGTCSACHTIIPPQYVIELRKSKGINYCMTCQRFLIWRHEEKVQEV